METGVDAMENEEASIAPANATEPFFTGEEKATTMERESGLWYRIRGAGRCLTCTTRFKIWIFSGPQTRRYDIVRIRSLTSMLEEWLEKSQTSHSIPDHARPGSTKAKEGKEQKATYTGPDKLHSTLALGAVSHTDPLAAVGREFPECVR